MSIVYRLFANWCLSSSKETARLAIALGYYAVSHGLHLRMLVAHSFSQTLHLSAQQNMSNGSFDRWLLLSVVSGIDIFSGALRGTCSMQWGKRGTIDWGAVATALVTTVIAKKAIVRLFCWRILKSTFKIGTFWNKPLKQLLISLLHFMQATVLFMCIF